MSRKLLMNNALQNNETSYSLIQDGLISLFDFSDGNVNTTELYDRTKNINNYFVKVSNVNEGYGFSGKYFKIQSSPYENIGSKLYVNKRFEEGCSSFVISLKVNSNTNFWYWYDGRGVDDVTAENGGYLINYRTSYESSICNSNNFKAITLNGSVKTSFKLEDIGLGIMTVYVEFYTPLKFQLTPLMRFTLNEQMDCDLFAIAVYNRTLSSSEILTNASILNSINREI